MVRTQSALTAGGSGFDVYSRLMPVYVSVGHTCSTSLVLPFFLSTTTVVHDVGSLVDGGGVVNSDPTVSEPAAGCPPSLLALVGCSAYRGPVDVR
jgi:hypothetical protein